VAVLNQSNGRCSISWQHHSATVIPDRIIVLRLCNTSLQFQKRSPNPFNRKQTKRQSICQCPDSTRRNGAAVRQRRSCIKLKSYIFCESTPDDVAPVSTIQENVGCSLKYSYSPSEELEVEVWYNLIAAFRKSTISLEFITLLRILIDSTKGLRMTLICRPR